MGSRLCVASLPSPERQPQPASSSAQPQPDGPATLCSRQAGGWWRVLWTPVPLSPGSRTEVLSRACLLSILANLTPCMTRGSLITWLLMLRGGRAALMCLLFRLPPPVLPWLLDLPRKGPGGRLVMFPEATAPCSSLWAGASQGLPARSRPDDAAPMRCPSPTVPCRPSRRMKSHCTSAVLACCVVTQLTPWRDVVRTPT